MKVLILGVGGLGGFFGAHLQKTNCDVTFLVTDKTKKLVSETGIKILSDFGNFKINPILITKKSLKINYDVIIISCKAYHLDEAIADLKPTQKNAIIIPLLNGQAHISKLEKAFKRENVFGGVAHVSSNTTSPGEIKHVGKIKRLTFGSRYEANKNIANEFYQLCRKADFQTMLSDNIDQDIWEKWIFIATIAGSTTLFQTSIDNISKKPNGKIFIQNLWNECINISKENGYELRAESKNLHEDLLFKSDTPFKASMLIDMEKKLMTEHEHIFSEFIKLGKKKKLNTSLLETCHLNMSIYEDNLNKEG